jgi:hypothetical protein
MAVFAICNELLVFPPFPIIESVIRFQDEALDVALSLLMICARFVSISSIVSSVLVRICSYRITMEFHQLALSYRCELHPVDTKYIRCNLRSGVRVLCNLVHFRHGTSDMLVGVVIPFFT